ncbi:thiamine-phosphate kinase [Shewanella sp. YIC-542]|uniref:thiamine-phosphate kinase n=1 Tax=Shewanella mytili TaxID=3377111 RepID=UPI00398F4C1B
MKEFQLIEHYFTGQSQHRKDVKLGIGDDCALVKPAENKVLAISTDTLVENVHFLPEMPPQILGYKALAVNLSDLAAMGAEPAWMTLALTMPTADEQWLQGFATGLFEAADYYMISLVGGDTTRGPKSITITVHGQVTEGKALTRSGAKPGDWIYVTGTLGDSALGLDILQGIRDVRSEHHDFLVNRHYHPTPRVLAGQALRGLASSAIDLSDGLLSDIQHILKASTVGAVIDVEKLPLSQAMSDSVTLETALNYALRGGEDYELLFTVPEAQRGALDTALSHAGVRFTQIGQIQAQNKCKFQYHGETFVPEHSGFEHFK